MLLHIVLLSLLLGLYPCANSKELLVAEEANPTLKAGKQETIKVSYEEDKEGEAASLKQQGLNRAFLKACYNNDIDSVMFLLNTGANLFSVIETGSTALHIAVEKGFIRLGKFLIEKDPRLVNTTDQEECTPLHVAALHGQVTLLQSLLDHGADIDQKDVYGATPLHCAAFNDESLLTRFILSKGANLSAVDRFDATALHVAATMGYTKVAVVLVLAGIPIDHQDQSGSIALHHASFNGHVETVRQLLTLGSSRDVINAKGKNPKEVWCGCGWKPTMRCNELCVSSKPRIRGGN